MAADRESGIDYSPWSWDVAEDIVWCVPDLFVMHGHPLPADAGDVNTAVPVSRERWLRTLRDDQAQRIREFCDGILQTGAGGEITYRIAVEGGIRWLLLQAAVGESRGGGVCRVLGHVRNVTAGKLLELRHEQTERELDQQRQVLERIAVGDPLEDTLAMLCRHLERIYPGAFCAIMLHDPETGVLRSVAAPSLAHDYSAAIDGLAVRDGNGACGTAAATGKIAVIEDVRSDSRVAPALELLETFGLRSIWSYPLHSVSGTVLGTLVFYRSEPHSPPEAEVRVAGSVAHLAALAIERDAIQSAIQMSARIYPASGLVNRSHFQELVNRRLAEPRRSTAVLFVELDRFKYLGDDLGHAASAALLAEVARRLRAAAGGGGVVGRFSGDEFTIAVDCPPSGQLEDLVTRVQVAFSTPVTTREYELFLVATVGVVRAERDGDAYSLIRDAAVAMQAARAEGSGGHRVYSRAMRTEGIDLIGRESELRRAIDFGELTLHYQPILDIANHRWDRLEALVRWKHPVRGLIAPAEFIPLAEKSGLIIPLGQRVIELAAQQGGRWVAAMPGLRIAINVSVLQLADPNFVEDMLALVEQAGLPAESINIEIAESGLIQKLDTVRPVLERLREHSVRTVIDDFGAGYSSIARLGDLPITSLKIDRNFIGSITSDPIARTVVRSIVAIAAAHGLTVVAEGIEDAATLAVVEELGCDYAQGFHVAVPAPPEEVATLLFEASAPPRLRLVTPSS